MVKTDLTSHEARQRLYDIVRRDVPFDEKACEALELGKQYLGADNAHLTQIDQETDHWKTIVSTDPPDGQFPPGLELNLGETYCRRTFEADAPIALSDASNQGWADDPAFEAHGLYCYHGTTLIVDDEPFGTVCFVAEDPRGEQFSDGETMFAELITRMLEREIEREQHEADLIRQTNLATVLNRVLRHNLRNDMSVIRGWTQLMANKLEDNLYGNIILSNIDKLIALSEKARDLDRFVAADFERTSTKIGALIEEVIESVEAEHPDASISFEYDREITTAVFPSFERAIKELIENAAKHGGDAPRVTVSIEAVPNAVEIQITDDGPGLADHEAAVLKTGSETPLQHGSGLGLWLAYWIVTSHDGSITATTENGTSLTVSIPRKQPTTVQNQLTQLTRARDQYQAAFEETSDAIVIVNDDARILDANPEAAALYGQDRQNLLGQALSDLLLEEFEFEDVWRELQTAGEAHGSMTIAGADGVDHSVEYAAQADIIPGQHLFISREITERKERERELEVAETVFQSTQDALFLVDIVGDQEYRLNRINEAFEVITQRSNDNITGMDPRELLGDEAGTEVQSWFDECVVRQEPVEFEQVVPANGESRIWQVRVTPVVQDGEVTQLVGAMRNITERKERERELTDLKERYETLLESAPDPVFVANGETGEIIETNEAAETLIGEPRDQIVGRHYTSFHPSEDIELYREIFEESLGKRGIISRLPDGSRLKLVTADGDTVPVEYSIGTVSLPDTPVVIGIFRDVSEQVKRERELEETTQRLQLALEGTNTGVWEWTIGTDEVHWSESLERLVGIESGTFNGTYDAFVEYIHPDDREKATAAVEQAAKTETRFQTDYRIKCEDGTQIWVESRGEVYDDGDDTKRMVGIVTDITERKEHEGEVQELKNQYEILAENFPDGAVFLIDSDLRFVRAGGEELNEVGLSPDDIEGARPHALFPDDVADELCHYYEQALNGNANTFEQEYGGDCYQIQTVPVRTDGETIDHLMAVSQNVTERKQQMEEIQRLKNRLELAVEGAELGVWDWNMKTDEVEFNDQWAEMLGHTPEELEPHLRTWESRVHPDDIEEVKAALDAHMQKNTEYYDTEHRMRTADGEWKWIRDIGEIVERDEDDEPIRAVGIHLDIDETRQYQQELEEKTERLGEFAGIVSHDLRNPLTVAAGNLELARDNCESPHLEAVERAHNRMKVLIEDLLTLARHGETVTETDAINLTTVVEECWKTVETAEASLTVESDRTVLADKSRLKQLFENLIRNAVEHGGSTVTVTVGGLENGFYVEDDGPGISEADSEVVFDAGYSTNDEGAGFGLSIVQRIVEAHEWNIRVRNSSNGGARFEITGVEFATE